MLGLFLFFCCLLLSLSLSAGYGSRAAAFKPRLSWEKRSATSRLEVDPAGVVGAQLAVAQQRERQARGRQRRGVARRAKRRGVVGMALALGVGDVQPAYRFVTLFRHIFHIFFAKRRGVVGVALALALCVGDVQPAPAKYYFITPFLSYLFLLFGGSPAASSSPSFSAAAAPIPPHLRSSWSPTPA